MQRDASDLVIHWHREIHEFGELPSYVCFAAHVLPVFATWLGGWSASFSLKVSEVTFKGGLHTMVLSRPNLLHVPCHKEAQAPYPPRHISECPTLAAQKGECTAGRGRSTEPHVIFCFPLPVGPSTGVCCP